MDVTFITGNAKKVEYFKALLGFEIAHQKLDLDEIQSLDLHEVVEHKVRQAYAIIKKPVVVEDVSLIFNSMGKLPGTLIKWFIQELGLDGGCKLADFSSDRSAVASCAYGYFDGSHLEIIESSL